MESLRKSYIQNLQNEKQIIEKTISRNTTQIENLISQPDSHYTRTQISKLTSNIQKNTERLNQINIDVPLVKDGELDHKLKDDLDQNAKYIKDLSRAQNLKKEDIKKQKILDTKTSKDYYEGLRQADRNNKRYDRDMIKSFQYYQRIVATIPDYIKRNLEQMPNNKGYIWKGISCYGTLPDEHNKPTVLFEKQKGGILLIHEWTPTMYNCYKKRDKERKTLAKSNYRKILS